MLNIPDGLFDRVRHIDSLISNYDHKVNFEVAEALQKDANLISDYPGLHFYGICWFEKNKFHCACMQFGKVVSVFAALTPHKLMKMVCKVYGND